MKKLLPLFSIALVVLTGGCVSSGYRGLIPGKDVHMKNFRQEVTTPWGHSVITADELDTIVRPDGTIAK